VLVQLCEDGGERFARVQLCEGVGSLSFTTKWVSAVKRNI
jgi:hypothetical protein